jgi:hypothetical protein
MPSLADLREPARPRRLGFLVGLAVAAPVVFGIAAFALPFAYGLIRQTVRDFDARLRLEDAYMQALCASAYDPSRDEQLCGCVQQVDFPSLDCRGRFLEWTITEQQTQCADGAIRPDAVGFCACVDRLVELREAEPDAAAREAIVLRYDACAELDDALQLPELADLVPAPPSGG